VSNVSSTHLNYYKFVRELDKLRQQKEAMKMINLEQIKINLYAKIRRRLGLQALLTTLRVNKATT